MITSTANARVKDIRSLQRRKERDSRGLAYVEGIRTVLGALESEWGDVALLLVAPGLLTSDHALAAVAEAEKRGIERLDLTADVFKSLSNRDGPQGLAAVVRQRWLSLRSLELEDGDTWIALTAVADPGNLGTILRTADAIGARGIILVEDSADPWAPTAMRASTGAIFTRHLVRAEWSAFVAWTREQNVTLVGATDDAETPYRGADYGSRTVLLMGSEREGLSKVQRQVCHQLVAIPMRGQVDSLNLGVAASLVLYEILDQREASSASGAPETSSALNVSDSPDVSAVTDVPEVAEVSE
ncbi:MAG: RNA methyltransferase [Dehalococcoidia bacterium]|jgi:RNA methyltransferase, TrmH family|nr:RNA methyltransferase [Dehalococcoidia bacterium]